MAFGHKIWRFSWGFIPLESTGREPEFVSNDSISILNTSDETAVVKIILYFENEDPAAEYRFEIKPERLRKFRVNDLIDPHAIPLGVSYGGKLESNVPVVVQIIKQNTGAAALALMGGMAYGEE